MEKSASGSFLAHFCHLLSSNELFRSSFCIFVADMSCDISKLIVCMHCEQNKVDSGKNCFWLIFRSFLAFAELKWAIWELIFNFSIKYPLWHIKIDILYALWTKWGKKWKKVLLAHFWPVFDIYWAQMSCLGAHFAFS